MPVPGYSVIDDNEIDPESPITSSLMFRLRDNILSILGIDNTDPAPVFTLPPSSLVNSLQTVYATWTNSSNATETITEMICGVRANAVETVEMLAESALWVAAGGVVNLFALETKYTAGVPSSVDTYVGAPGSIGSNPITVTNLPLDNAWHQIWATSGRSIDGKARYDATYVYIQFRINYPSGIATAQQSNPSFFIKSFVAK